MTGSVPRHDGETFYRSPPWGWPCFHCGETFRALGDARNHFGFDPGATPACRLDPEHVRAELRRYRAAETELRTVQERLVNVRSLGDGAPFLPHDHECIYDLCTRAIEAIGDVHGEGSS